MKKALLIHEESVRNVFQSNLSTKQAISLIHTTTVAEIIRTLAPNRVLKEKLPDIHPSKASLPCKIRSNLSRLRSGYYNLT